ncbi:YciI family protein [Oceanibium sediminis]|uniref:YciI family protein n=1 Tax=Oceanibium sediminis TaxID=2026339 RepID=UPI000DD3CC2D|nr:YciI family protein [Oceanibium sediminis]
MLFALICIDKPGALEVRKANRGAHLAYLNETGVVLQAGPFLDDEGQMNGSLLVIDVADRAAAEAFAAGDPYANAGLFDAVTIRAWNKVI